MNRKVKYWLIGVTIAVVVLWFLFALMFPYMAYIADTDPRGDCPCYGWPF